MSNIDSSNFTQSLHRLSKPLPDWFGDSIFVPWKLHTGKRFEIVEPDSIGVVFSKERTTDPVLITALEEAQDKSLIS